MNPKLVLLHPAKEVYDTLSHELAHCLDFVIRGYWRGTEDSFHDDFWSFLHKRMGGNGKKNIETITFKYQLRRVSEASKEVQENFNSIDINEL
jgi:predicted SprT family Zn-dependent metalloprotease